MKPIKFFSKNVVLFCLPVVLSQSCFCQGSDTTTSTPSKTTASKQATSTDAAKTSAPKQATSGGAAKATASKQATSTDAAKTSAPKQATSGGAAKITGSQQSGSSDAAKITGSQQGTSSDAAKKSYSKQGTSNAATKGTASKQGTSSGPATTTTSNQNASSGGSTSNAGEGGASSLVGEGSIQSGSGSPLISNSKQEELKKDNLSNINKLLDEYSFYQKDETKIKDSYFSSQKNLEKNFNQLSNVAKKLALVYMDMYLEEENIESKFISEIMPLLDKCLPTNLSLEPGLKNTTSKVVDNVDDIENLIQKFYKVLKAENQGTTTEHNQSQGIFLGLESIRNQVDQSHMSLLELTGHSINYRSMEKENLKSKKYVHDIIERMSNHLLSKGHMLDDKKTLETMCTNYLISSRKILKQQENLIKALKNDPSSIIEEVKPIFSLLEIEKDTNIES